jgi:hypothetical protein
MASVGVTRDNRADATANDYDGLPKMIIQFEGKVNGQAQKPEPVILAMAGLRQETVNLPDEYDDYQELQRKYSLVYGSVGGWPDDIEGEDDYLDNYADTDKTLTIVDNCEGEIVDYRAATRQARMMVDQDFCVQECNKGKESGEDIDCNGVCANAINMPWYMAQGGVYHNGYPFSLPNPYAGLNEQNDEWSFPNIESLFILPGQNRKVPNMGVQQDSTQQVNRDFQTRKEEDASGITTTDEVNWGTTTTRTILYNDHLDPDTGIAQPSINLETDEYDTTRAEQGTTTWQTPWQTE